MIIARLTIMPMLMMIEIMQRWMDGWKRTDRDPLPSPLPPTHTQTTTIHTTPSKFLELVFTYSYTYILGRQIVLILANNHEILLLKGAWIGFYNTQRIVAFWVVSNWESVPEMFSKPHKIFSDLLVTDCFNII